MMNKKYEEILFQSMNPKYKYGYQINIKNLDGLPEFIKFCESISYETRIDCLGGKNVSSFQRKQIHDRSVDDVINTMRDPMTGIKIYQYPQWKIFEWEKWEDGYIEFFLRTNVDDRDYNELFIWMYIEMKHLKSIINFKNIFNE